MELANRMKEFQTVLLGAWSKESSTKWTPENPALGQCGVTALVAQDVFGGEILKTTSPGGMHFYNRIAGHKYDFTETQFAEPIQYDDLTSSREEAFCDTNAMQYGHLKAAVLRKLASTLSEL